MQQRKLSGGGFSCVDVSAATTEQRQEIRPTRPGSYDVVLPNDRVRHVTVDPKANGQQLLDLVCSDLGVFDESDYFGLTYSGSRREELWINTRNRLVKQVASGSRLRLRVKFFVQPHMLVLDETRHLFYLDARSRVATEGHWLESDEGEGEGEGNSLAQLLSLVAQAELGDLVDGDSLPDYPSLSSNSNDRPQQQRLADAVAELHARLGGTQPKAARQRFLEMAGRQRMYGCRYHSAKDCFESRLVIAVGPKAVCFCRPDRTVIDRYPYPRVQKVTISNRVIYFSLCQEDGRVKEVGYRLVTRQAANALYRCVTETHSFFRCDTVRSGVVDQTSRDGKSALASFFAESDGTVAPTFVFDVRRTAKEVHDKARRRLHTCNTAAAFRQCNSGSSIDSADSSASSASFSSSSAASSASDDDEEEEEEKEQQRTAAVKFEVPEDSSRRSSTDSQEQSETELELVSLRSRLHQLQQSQLCRICMDGCIDIVLIPCGHVLSCGDCSERLTDCPLCRQAIAQRLPCQLP